MLRKLGSHLRNQWAGVLALFLVLGGGTAYAVTQIDRNSVKSKHIVNGQVKSADVADNGLTGADVDEGTLALGAEPWRVLNTPGNPSFDNGSECSWSNFGSGFTSGAFVRDASGFVHLRGLVRAGKPFDDVCDISGAFIDGKIFTLPVGYRPEGNEVFATLSDGAPGRIDVRGNGDVFALPPATGGSVKQWISMSGITFRCTPSGVDGCP